MKFISYFIIALLFTTACVNKKTEHNLSEYKAQFSHDEFTYRGAYVWSFGLMKTEQTSLHTFYPDKITYRMKGKVYATSYTMQMLSFEKENNKWIGMDDKGTIYVLFFKNKTDNSIDIYKHKCKSKGIEEALNFMVPAADETADHGWNTYHLNADNTKDILPISGRFSNKKDTITIKDTNFLFEHKNYQKISYHSGERRWVGQFENQYLQVFFNHLEAKDSIQIATYKSGDLENLYNTKYNSIEKWNYYERD